MPSKSQPAMDTASLEAGIKEVLIQMELSLSANKEKTSFVDAELLRIREEQNRRHEERGRLAAEKDYLTDRISKIHAMLADGGPDGSY